VIACFTPVILIRSETDMVVANLGNLSFGIYTNTVGHTHTHAHTIA